MAAVGLTFLVFVWLGISAFNSQHFLEATVSWSAAIVWYLILCVTYYRKRDK
jgi:hypothetical protein